MEKNLKLAWIAGLIYLAISIPETALDITRFSNELSDSLIPLYWIISIGGIITTIFFYRGFILIGEELMNNVLIVSSYLTIISSIIVYIYGLATIGQVSTEKHAAEIAIPITFGFIGVFFGVGVFQLKDQFGGTAMAAGILEIIAGITLIIVVLFFIGLVLLIPATILEVLILLKASQNFNAILEQKYSTTKKV